MIIANAGLARFLNIILPKGGYALVTIEAYFDESETRDGVPLICVAGYLFDAQKHAVFDKEWSSMLADFRIPFFHMTEIQACAARYCHLGSDLRRALVRRATKIIKDNFAYGLVVSTEPIAYASIMPGHPLIGHAYSHCAVGCIRATRVWADQRDYREDIAYFYESGHRYADEANRIMNTIARDPVSRKDYRYGGHGFVPKAKASALQAADLLAWQYTQNWIRNTKGAFSRDDFVELIDENYMAWHHDEERLREFSAMANNAILAYPEASLIDPSE
ncbi:MAG: hypothetical protein KIT16_14035 [Rhodospirillaceae bacterium]|nr:hypothetical protein [Rhodospirillaceae bacterium]